MCGNRIMKTAANALQGVVGIRKSSRGVNLIKAQYSIWTHGNIIMYS
jgi:hypothetical protein